MYAMMKSLISTILKITLFTNLIGTVLSECHLCPMAYKPVCGSDGRTYSNSICMKCHNPGLVIEYTGPCESPPYVSSEQSLENGKKSVEVKGHSLEEFSASDLPKDQLLPSVYDLEVDSDSTGSSEEYYDSSDEVNIPHKNTNNYPEFR